MQNEYSGEEISWRLSHLTLLREATTSRHVPEALKEACFTYDGPPRPSESKHGLSTAGSHRYDICFPHAANREADT